MVWDKATDTSVRVSTLMFSDDLRKQARGSDANLRLAFNDYFIKSIIIKKDGGYLMAAESMYTTSRGGGPFNRWDYMGWGNPGPTRWIIIPIVPIILRGAGTVMATIVGAAISLPVIMQIIS